ncbi:phytanoyl-CoA dioxygenase family protein [Pleionea mediterranea]|uniref:Phytanoyl-CoA dioxygenase PhyH n=1 Tax=Pleionea mediterranea TaxID=523701 RepID=A0A316FD02_9GAMM|nr:phytanoyl-CoA dioxygenase family protein [Pleionea mediterranea]PWK45369.1 phytanoyl-CoA dioxygenase PhyH [Pleionea mediterranea]
MAFSENGFEIVENILSMDDIETIKRELTTLELKGGGIRNAEKKLISVATLVKSHWLLDLASDYLNGKAKFVRSIVFIKSISNNWLVSWHQDKTVSVSKNINRLGWSNWTEKDGVLNVQPPIEVLENMITFRIHLDEATEENGCLKVIPNSHKEGVLSQQSITHYTEHHKSIHCKAPAGSALVMRPHVLHASNKSTSTQPRRVLHIEFSCYQLPDGVKWA